MDIVIYTLFFISLFIILKTDDEDKNAEKEQSLQNEFDESEIKKFEMIELLSERELIQHLKKFHSAKLSVEKGHLQKAQKEFEDAILIIENGVDLKIRKLSPPSACYIDYSKFLYNIGDHEKSKDILARYVNLCRDCGDIYINVNDLDNKIKKD